MNVLSLFDGISCGQVALERTGIPVENYYASEVDKYVIQVTQKNYPNTIQLGDITSVNGCSLPKIDLLIGGSPCQGFSFAGKQLNFKDPKSALFFEYVRLLEELKPKYFLLENVKMKKEYQEVISKLLGVEPIEINSALVSAQNRKRLYWTNIPNVSQPEDKGIYLKDIVHKGPVDQEFYMKEGWLNWWKKNCEFQVKKKYSVINPDKAITMTARQYASWNGNFVVQENTKKGYVLVGPNEGVDLTFIKSKTRRGRHMKIKSNCLPAGSYNFSWWDGKAIRKLTPTECERLQTLQDNYTEGVSNSQRYKALGNGWTVDIIAHILKEVI